MTTRVLIILAGIFMACTIPSHARSLCAPWPALKKTLEEHQENPAAVGVLSENAILVVLATASGSKFTVLSVHKNGLACVMAAGSRWVQRGSSVKIPVHAPPNLAP